MLRWVLKDRRSGVILGSDQHLPFQLQVRHTVQMLVWLTNGKFPMVSIVMKPTIDSNFAG